MKKRLILAAVVAILFLHLPPAACCEGQEVEGLSGDLKSDDMAIPSSASDQLEEVEGLGAAETLPETIWMNGIGAGFRKDTFQAGGAVGAGFGTKVFGGKLTHDLASASVNFGWIFTDVVAPDKWYRGNGELLGELFGGFQFHPNGRYLVGLTPLIRYNFATGSRWVPFVNGGAGLSATDIEGVDLSGTFQFNLQVGAGVHYFLSDRTALTAQYRWLHLSNAGTREPNGGTNTQMFFAGVDWFF